MMGYIKLGRSRALHVEMCRAFSAQPLFARHKHKGEIIFDLPYCRIIYTPARQGTSKGIKDRGKPDRVFSETAGPSAEDRP